MPAPGDLKAFISQEMLPQTHFSLLEPLAAEARKYETFDAFQAAFLREIKHGMYYHVTSDPHFQIRPEVGPRDMSSMAMGGMEPGKLMVTSHLELWAEEYKYKGTRNYVAVIDMSQVPKETYWQVSRGFGNEFWVNDPSKARVVKVIPIDQALKESAEYQDILESTIHGPEDLKRFYEWAHKSQEKFQPQTLGSLEQLAPKVIKRYPIEPITVQVGTAKVRGEFRKVEGDVEPDIEVVVLSPKGAIPSGGQEEKDLQKAVDELEQTLKNRIQEVYQDEVPLRGEPVKGVYPTVLTMDEYNKLWKPQGWNLIIIGPTSTWREEWGIWEAIRDIVQNALDETEAYQWGYDELGLWISDKGKGVAVADFLLGPPKVKPDYARGKFGEGMKIAALALVRKVYPVSIKTVGREIWIIFIEQMTDGKAQSLAALWRPGGTTQGTKFHVIGYFGTAYPDRFAGNLPKFAIRAQVPAPVTEPVQRYNQLIVEEFPPETGKVEPGRPASDFISGPRIYARDIYLRKINSTFSYNLWGFPLAPDRHGPAEEGELWADMGRLWCGVKDLKLLEVFFQMVKSPPVVETDEGRFLSMSTYKMDNNPVTHKPYAEMLKENASVWRQAWANNFHDNAVIRTDERWDATVKHLGYYSISLLYDVVSTISRVIKTDNDLIMESQERLREVQIIADKDLSPTQRVHLDLAREIAERIGGDPRIHGVHAAIIPPASDRVRTAGMYGRTTQEVFISSEQLIRARDTVDTTVHEVAHHTSGAEDGEEAHTQELTSLAGTVVHLTANRSFDHIIGKKEFTW